MWHVWRSAFRVLVGKPERRRQLGRFRRRLEDTAKVDGEEISGQGVDGIHLSHDRDRRRAVMHVVMNLAGSVKRGEFLD
jgi:hypothetical protein